MNRDPSDGVRRRRVLSALGTGVFAGAAGCLSGEDSNRDETPTGNSGTQSTPDDGTSRQSDLLPEPSLGPEDAEVTVEVYKDFACPHCASYNESVKPQIASEYVEPGVVRLVHRDFPIPVNDPESWRAASAAREVQVGAGDEAFFAYADSLFANQSDFGLDTYAELAEAVSGERVRSAAEQRRYRDTVEDDRSSGIDREVTGTPTVFVNDAKPDGWDWDSVRAAIEDARPQ